MRVTKIDPVLALTGEWTSYSSAGMCKCIDCKHFRSCSMRLSPGTRLADPCQDPHSHSQRQRC
jgi:hypothetical protein